MVIRILAILCLLPVAAWAVSGSDVSPGDACSNEDAVMMTANPSGDGGYVLTCESGTWKATLSGATPTEDEHFATKAYVDSAGGSGGGSTPCSSRPTCTSGNISSEPICKVPGGPYDGSELCVQRFDFRNQNNSFVNLAYVNLGAAQTLCANQGDGFYVPNASEMSTLYTNRTAIGNMTTVSGHYGTATFWSSTIMRTIEASSGALSVINPSSLNVTSYVHIRCVTRK